MKYAFFCLIFGFLVLSCQNPSQENAFANCKYGKPEAIFSSEQEEVKKHQFTIKKQEGVENVSFESGLELIIYQSGCDYIKQQYQFEISQINDTLDSSSQEYWIIKTIESFQKLGDLGPEFFSYSSWAQAIAERAGEFKLAEFLEVQPGFYVKIDRIESSNKNLLLVTLSEEPES